MHWAEVLFSVLIGAPFLFFCFCVLYLWRLALNALLWRSHLPALTPPAPNASPAPLPPSPDVRLRFVLLLPAHNEEMVLGAVLDGLKTLDYPASLYRTLVIADNCTDKTAEIAREKGVLVWERFDKTQIGKGYALQWAMERLLCPQENPDVASDATLCAFDGAVVCDADTLVAPNLLRAFAEEMERGGKALQARYEVLNASESWRTRLMSCALALAHIVKPLGRERLGLSEGLKGNGMAFAREALERAPWSGASITEDIEYALRLCREGYRVQFVPQTAVWAQMPVTAAQAKSQRQRWEGGRYQIVFSTAPRLLLESFQKRSRILRDRAIELFIPPFAEMFAVPALLGALCLAFAWAFGWHSARLLALGWGTLLGLQGAYLFLGLWVARTPLKVALSLLGAPFYILWKFGVYVAMARSRSAGGWKRTERREL